MMPPRLDINEEAVKAAIKSALERDTRRDISKKALTFSVMSLVAIFGAIISATAYITRKLDSIDRGRWTVWNEHVAWEQFADRNPDMKFKKPDVYAIRQSFQE